MTKTKQYLPIWGITVFLILALMLCIKYQLNNVFAWVSFHDPVSNIELKPVYDKHDAKYRLFLPSYLTVDQVEMKKIPGISVTIKDKDQICDFSQRGGVPLGKDLIIATGFLSYGWSEIIQVWQCDKLPTLHIQAESDVIEYLHADKENSREVSVKLIGPDQMKIFSDLGVLSGRGNGTWEGQAKRPYNLSFPEEKTFGPFKNISNFCLLAEHSDDSKVKNSTAYYLGSELNIPYASEYMYIDVFVNGAYLGLYGVVTKDNYKGFIQTDNIQAVFEFTSNAQNVDFGTYVTKKPINVIYGEVKFVRDILTELEKAINEKNWEKCESIIDLDSVARKYTLEEFMANMDLTHASQYYFINDENKIQCMLPWDYDWSLGYSVTYYNNKQVYEIKAYRSYASWYTMLLENDKFRDLIVKELQGNYTEEMITSVVKHMRDNQQLIDTSRECDIARWKNLRPFRPFTAERKSMDTYYWKYRIFLQERKKFLLNYFSNTDNFCKVSFVGDHYSNLCIPKGELLWKYLDGANIILAEDSELWYTKSGMTPEQVQEVTGDITFYSKNNN